VVKINTVNELYTEVKENCFQSAPSPSLQMPVQFRFLFSLTFSRYFCRHGKTESRGLTVPFGKRIRNLCSRLCGGGGEGRKGRSFEVDWDGWTDAETRHTVTCGPRDMLALRRVLHCLIP
jgi:hypothetical protein